MQLHIFLKRLTHLIFVSILFVSCTTTIDWEKQIDELTTGQAYVIPIGETTITLNDILTQFDSLDFIDADDNSIFVKYNDTIDWNFRKFDVLDNLESMTDEFMPMASIPNPGNLPQLPISGVILEKEFSHVLNLTFNANTNIQRVDRAEINSAKIEFTVMVDNTVIDPSKVTITAMFPTEFFVFDGSGESKIVYKPDNLNTPEVREVPAFKLFSPNGQQSVTMTIKVAIDTRDIPVIVKPTTKISIHYKLFDINAKAYFGSFKPSISLAMQEGTLDVTEFTNLVPKAGIFKLAEPQISMDVYNNSGMRLKFKIDSIKAFKSNDATFTPVYALFDNNNTQFKVSDLSRRMTLLDPPAKTTLVLNNQTENGQIARFFDRFPLPDRLFYRYFLSNNAQPSDPLDFITPNDYIKAIMAVKVPLKLNVGSNFQFVDTLKNVDMESLVNLNIIDQMLLVMKVTNSLPLKGKLSLKFLDANELPIEGLTVLSDSIIKAPTIDAEGVVLPNSSAVSDLKIVVESSQLPKLILAKNIVYTIKVENEENRKITLQKENFIKLKLGKYSKGE